MSSALVTATVATGMVAAAMVSAAVPLLPSLVAVIVAAPPPAARTSPVMLSTVATAGALDVQRTWRPVSAAPAESRVSAASRSVSPVRRLAVAGVTSTLDTGTSCTASVVVAVFPSAAAVMVALPAATPVTTPFASTRAMLSADDVQVTARPLSVLPAASLGAATSVIVRPTNTVPLAGVSATLPTGAVFPPALLPGCSTGGFVTGAVIASDPPQAASVSVTPATSAV